MDVYHAIMAAADQIEQNPRSFNFFEGNIPGEGRYPSDGQSCALGWVGKFLSRPIDALPGYWCFSKVPRELGFACADEVGVGLFYQRMDELTGGVQKPKFNVVYGADWRYDAQLCADGLRRYAIKYHAPKPTIPESIWEIFSCQAPSPIPSTATESLTTGFELLQTRRFRLIDALLTS